MMKVKQILVGAVVMGLVLALTWGPGLAQGPEERTQPPGTLSIEAVVRSAFTYQGMLRENGVPVTGTRDMVFRLFSDAACTTPVGGDMSMPGVAVDRGLFSIELSVSPEHFDGQGLWLGIQVAGTTVGCQEILPVPYALSLRPGARIVGEQPDWDAIHVQNTATKGASYGVYAQSHSTGGMGLWGNASASSGDTYGVYGLSLSTSGRGVYGLASASSGDTYGVYGESRSPSGSGVYGYASASSGTTRGVKGQSNSTSGFGVVGSATASSGTTYGVFGSSSSSAGSGVYGYASASSGATRGVQGESASDSGRGLYGLASASSGETFGVLGESDSTAGRGVFGYAIASSGETYGVQGESLSTSGRGVYGYAAAATGETYGVYGRSASPDGAGVLARGVESGADLILGGDSGSQDNGTIYSDPAYSSSDIVLVTNDTLRIDLDQDNFGLGGEDADFEIRDKDDTLIFNVDESGDVTFGGPGVAAFPRPAFDSGWLSLGLGASTTRTHNLGGNTDNYVVDMMCRDDVSWGVHNRYVGGESLSSPGGLVYNEGTYWRNLTTSTITIVRLSSDIGCDSIRVRIWVYP